MAGINVESLKIGGVTAISSTRAGTLTSLTLSSTLTMTGATIALNPLANVNVTGSPAITNGLTFGTNILTVDFADNRVGILTAAPSYSLHVVGTAGVTGLLTLSNGIFFDTASGFVAQPGMRRTPAGGVTIVAGTGSSYDFALYDAAGNGAVVMPTGTKHLQFFGNVGFYGTAPIAKQTGVAVTAAGIHAALSSLGLIS